MVSVLGLADRSDERVVDALGSAPRVSSAYRHLLRRGQSAPPAIRAGLCLLGHDPDAHVRAMAVELVGRFVHSNAEAEAALAHARDADSSPAVRKKAGWYAPGGTIHRRTQDLLC